MRTTAREGKRKCGTTWPLAGLRLRHKVTYRQNAGRICRHLPVIFNDLRMALKLRVLAL
jgi:hypothetical protein